MLQLQKFYPSAMLRAALRFLIALALILQGSVGATAAFASGNGHHCNSAVSHGGQAPKCPCCPAKSFGMSCADACVAVAALPTIPATFVFALASTPAPIERVMFIGAAIDTPTRPPIA